MRRFIQLASAGLAVAAIVSVAACGGTSTYLQPTPTSPTPTPIPTPTPTPNPSLACDDQPLPGTYTSMSLSGNYVPSGGGSGGVFTADTNPGKSTYAVTQFAQNSATPTPTPVPSATPTPIGIPIYTWSGLYSVTGIGAISNGCFAIATTQDGSPLPSESDSGGAIAFPIFAANYTLGSSVAGAITSLSVNLTANGGSGSFALDNGSSGSITLGPRQTSTLAELRQHKALPLRLPRPF